jgi:hypothetical protein
MSILNSGRGVSLKIKVTALAAAVTLSGAAAFIPLAALAQQTTSQLIDQLSAEIARLQTQLLSLQGAGGSSVSSASSASRCSFTRSLSQGTNGQDVKCLQQYLNSAGYQVSARGAGSPGNETTFFGGLTRAAVARWQAGNGVSPAVGYFGPISRAKYDSLIAVAPPSGRPPPLDIPPPPVVIGSGLTVTSVSDQPPATLAPQSAARVPFVKAILTASADGDVSVKSITVERKGLADDAAFDGILLLDADGTQIGLSKTLSSEHKVVLNEPFTVRAGTSKTVIVAANMASSLTNQAGQVAKLAIVAVDAGTSNVNASFPIESNGMTINATLSIGSVTMSIGSLDPGAANTKNVGTKGYYLASVKASVGSAENVTFESMRFNQAGSAGSSDLENVVVKAGDREYAAVVSSDGKYYIANFTGGLKVAKGGTVEFSIKADLANGSSRTVDMNILRKSDIVVRGDVFGYAILVGGGSTGAASAGNFSSNQEPFFNAYAATIDKGSVLVSSSNKVAAGNVPIDVNDTTIGAFLLDVKGEKLQVSSFKLNFTFTGTGTSSDITGVKIYDANGAIVAGPKDPSSGVVTFTDTWTAPVGENHYYVKAKLDTTFVSNDTVQVSLDPDDNITAKGEVTGLSISPTPTTLVTASTQTVKAAALAFSVSPTPFAQNVVRGVNGYMFATYIFDATQSGEDVRVTSVQLRDTLSANGVGDEVNTCVLYDGTTALNTGSDVQNPSDPSSGTNNDLTFTLTNNLIIPKGTSKKVDLKCNISPSATANSTHSWGTNAAAANINSVGAQTSQAITETITTSTGSIMTVKTAGSFTVVKDSTAPVAAIVLSGKTDVPMNVLKFHATDEAVRITDLTLTYSSSTASTSDFIRATVWDGAVRVGVAQWAGGNALNATTTLCGGSTLPCADNPSYGGFVVPKDGDALLTIKADIASISVSASTTAGRLLAIDYNGISSSTGVGQSSNAKLGSLSNTNTDGSSMQIMKSVPKVEKVAVPTTSISPTNLSLYRFKVTADPAGPIALYKLTFTVSSSSVAATTSNFNIYGYTDSGFSQNAYAINPLHNANVDCIGQSVLDTDTNCKTDTTGSGTASSTEVVFFFDPVANTASSTEAIIISAGSTVYFELRGDFSNPGATTGNSVTVQLEGDAARSVREAGSTTMGAGGLGLIGFHDSGRGLLGTAAAIASQSANNDFVWSPMSTSTSLTGATSTTDWANGFKVQGLPDTNLSANTFTN